MPEPHVLLEKSGSVARLVLNRPDKRNALTFGDAQLLTDKLHEAENDDDVKVIILKGRGPSFCVGHDFDDVVEQYGLDERDENGRYVRPSVRRRLQIDRRLAEEYMAFQYAVKPVIAQVQGDCIGYGIYLAELVDLVVCADTARFSHAEQRLGLAGNTWHLNTLLLQYGPKKTREMLLFGSSFSGTEAVNLGMANIAVPEEQLEATAEEWAEQSPGTRRTRSSPARPCTSWRWIRSVALSNSSAATSVTSSAPISGWRTTSSTSSAPVVIKALSRPTASGTQRSAGRSRPHPAPSPRGAHHDLIE